ncbi:hypothetical protein D1841_11495 [Neglecta sp. X4]|uniref:DUF6017 domain-containing protein n=1 Tax=unclassified Neglectibacter TaxID=2632164 RepID=UPI001367B8DC|nr:MULTISPECIES: DUF6017 domain-containing protein [unclassified Neglectibacter]NBI18210.1 hypothetical protein [Neglectibacter sp. 59]NBJ73887.1 hypothetical protein [Neglectibacter sp. X4]NCE81659.1 hypothetical protein [Neglectibacter sp. X58]
MKDRLDYDYFYGGESEQFSFYRIPRQLIVGPEFKHVSTDAKLLYGLMLDRMGLSARNGWYDEENRVFIYYPLDEIKEALNCGNDKAVKLLAELDSGKGIGLIQRVKQGQGKPARIYVKRFTTREVPDTDNRPSPPSRLPESRNPDFGKTEVKSSENQKSRLRENRSADFGKSECNYTYMNQTERSYTHPSIRPEMEKMDWAACRKGVMENISYSQLVEEYGAEDVEGVTDLITDILTSAQPIVRIGKEDLPLSVVQSRFRKLDETHIQYVFDCLSRNTTKVRNIRAYLLTSLYNAPATIGQFYQAEVQHDLYGSG